VVGPGTLDRLCGARVTPPGGVAVRGRRAPVRARVPEGLAEAGRSS